MFDSLPVFDFYFHHLTYTVSSKVTGLARQKWAQRLVIITAVIFLSAILPAFLPDTRLLLFTGLIPAAAAVLLFLYRPPLGLVALVVVALVFPSPELPGGFNVAVLLLILLIGLWLAEMFIVQRHVWVIASRPVKPLLFLLLVALIATLFGQLPWFRYVRPAPLEAQLGGLATFVLAAGAFLLAAQQIRELRWLQWLTWVYVALGALFVAGWLLPPLGRFTSRLFQLGATGNSLFWTWLAAVAFSQALFNRKLHPGWRLILAGIVAMTLYVAAVLNNDWKSGYLPPLAALAVIFALRSRPAGLLMVLVAPVAAFYLSSQAIATDQYSYGTRIDAWIILFEIIKVNPVLGLGPANYYWYTPLFPIRGWRVRFNSHNQYVDIIAQTGILGMICVIWFAIEEGLLGWRLRHQAPAGFAQAYVYGVLGGLAGMVVAGMLADWIFPFVYNIGLNGFRGAIPAWLFLGGLVSVEQMILQKKATVQV